MCLTLVYKCGFDYVLTVTISVVGFSPLLGFQIVDYLPICFTPEKFVTL